VGQLNFKQIPLVVVVGRADNRDLLVCFCIKVIFISQLSLVVDMLRRGEKGKQERGK